MVTVDYDELSLAFDFVSSGAPMEHQAFVSLDTGRIFWASVSNPVEDEELPDDLDTSDRYLEIPHKNDLDLGQELALQFVEERLPWQYNRAAAIFGRRGAYRRFKDLLASEGCLDQWYAFEAEATERARRAWCRENDIHLGERGAEASA